MGGGPFLESFRRVKQIAIGGFGTVDEGVGPNGELVAIKRELASDRVTRPILEHEYHVYKVLAGHACIPDVKAYGRQHKYNIVVMDLLGPSLGDRFRCCASRFSLKTTARLALGMLDAIEYIHSRGFIHRDIKPENFLLGRGTKSNFVHVVDFGLARRWKNSSTVTHIPSEGGLCVIGTLHFASINAHLGQAQTRRDDLQALAYAVILFARGNLPWDHIRGGTQKHCERRVLEKKRSWTTVRLCQDLPHELEEFSSYCFGLEIGEEPDYQMLRDKLVSIANREGWKADAKFEWDEPGWTASVPHKPATSLLKQMPLPCVKRGDIVLLKLIPGKSLDYELPPRPLDPSFFPHQALIGMEQQPPYRPAMVRRVISREDDPAYFTLEVYPLLRRSGLDGLSTRRSRSFLPLETLIETTTGMPVPCDDIFVYMTSLLRGFKIEYIQAASFTPQLSVPECDIGRLEAELSKVPSPYSIVYDSDDEETRTIRRRLPEDGYSSISVMEMRTCDASDLSGASGTTVDLSGVNGWILELIQVEEVRRMEDGELGDDSDDDSVGDLATCDFPRAVNRQLSCTVRTLSSF